MRGNQTEAQAARSRRVLVGIILIAWIVEIVIGVATRHILFLAVVSVVDAYFVFRASGGCKGRSQGGSATP